MRNDHLPIFSGLSKLRSRILPLVAGFTLALGLTSIVNAAPPITADYQAVPPFVAENSGKPNVIIALDISGSMKAVAYDDADPGNWRTKLHDDFNPAKSYFGYFKGNGQRYSYNTTYGFYVEDNAGDWDGNFLNWIAMRRMDVVRKVLVGGKVRDRAGENLGGTTYYVVEGQNEPVDYTFRKSYSGGSAFSPFPDNQEFTIADGMIKPTVLNASDSVIVSSEMEVGRVSMDWTVGDTWKPVSFLNTYSNPVVVATSVSYNGADPVNARVRNVTPAGFEIRMQEWDHKDGNHTTEDIFFIVAEEGSHSIDLKSGGDLDFYAGKKVTSTTTTASTPAFDTVVFGSSISNPAVFTGISTFNDAAAVTARTQNITGSGFEVALQEEEQAQTLDPAHGTEAIHYIAIEKGSGIADITEVPVEIDETGSSVSENWNTITFATTFSGTPFVPMSSQTYSDVDTANIRYGNAVVSGTQYDVQMDEETSSDGETAHFAENVAYMAVAANTGFNIMVGETSEPTGIVQDNSGGMRIGMAVYNYDHNRSPTNIYTGNTVNGGTFKPCYPDTSLPVASQTNFDICLDTHVKAPLDNIIDVIEDHPLIWGTTPIAETLYEIYGYVNQKDNSAGQGHVQWYDNGTETTTNPIPSYEVSNDWDPYYYSEYSDTLKCAKTFVLHFNDGAPYKDWDTAEDPTTIPSDGVGPDGAQEELDDLARWVRNVDCRSDISGHQEIISYYVYAALGEGQLNNDSTRRMRESAANGGFVDADGDNAPDPAHPADFISYYNTFLGGGSCTPNEWDANGDCNPDTFYLANDGAQLVTELSAAFASITRRASAGGAASVISASSSGEGAIYQANFQTMMSDSTYQVAWTGDVHSLLVDAAGLIRQDNNSNKTLDDALTDNIVDMCFNAADQTVYVKLSTSLADRPTVAQTNACSVTVFNKTLFDINYLWSGGDWLASLNDTQAVTQRAYGSAAKGRHIITAIDTDTNTAPAAAIITSAEQVDFTDTTFTDSNAGLLQAGDAAEAAKIVDFIRGKDQAGMRSRALSGGRTWRLGDVIYSTPTNVSRPSEAFDLLYGDTSYNIFLKQYINRRHMVYAGGNDGMLHAFNAGWYDAINHRFEKGPSGTTQYELGTEMWAYVPYNLLPHLKYLTDTNYGNTTGNHVYYVDLKPRIFDAQIFPVDATHPGGWGTVLVGGMRFGGGEISVDVDTTSPGSDVRSMRSAYFILDITNPEQAPVLLTEFTHEDLGFTTVEPAPFVVGGNWYLMLGSGPTADKTGLTAASSSQQAKIFLLNLNTMALESGFATGGADGDGILTLPDVESFISDMVSVDWNLDYNADAVFFGTVAGSSSPWSGKLYQVRIQDSTASPVTTSATGSWTATEFFDAGKPIVARPSFAYDTKGNRWVLVGTGRYYTRDDALDTASQRFMGLKEPRDTSGNFTGASPSFANLVDVSNASVRENSGTLTGVTLSPSLSPSTFANLQTRMMSYSNATEYQDGWYRDITPAGNRVLGEATILGDTLTHTLYKPSPLACIVAGTSQLSVTNFVTGTGASPPIIGTKGTADANGNRIVETIVDLGVAPSLTPSLHTGNNYSTDGGSKAFLQTSTGKIVTIEQQNASPIRSGEASWRELPQ